MVKITGKENEQNAVTFEEALDAAGSGGKFQTKVILIGSFTLLSSYIAIAFMSYVLPSAQCDLKMDSQDKANLISSGFLGLVGSCHLWGFLSDRLGRRYVLIRCLLVDGILYLVTSLTPYYSVIMIWRFFNGFACCGGIVSLYPYIGEFHSSKNRTKALMKMSMLASVAYIFMPGLAWAILPLKFSFEVYPGLVFKSWRLYYAVCGVPSLTCSVLINFLPESPKFLLAKGDKIKALKILQTIHKENSRKDQNDNFLIKNIKTDEAEKIIKIDDNSNKILAFFKLIWNQTVPLFKSPHRLNIFLICATQYLFYFSNGGIYLWMAEIINRLATFNNENGDLKATFCEIVQYKPKETLKINANNYIKYENILNSTNNTNLNDISKILSQEECNEDIDLSVYIQLEILGLFQFVALFLILILEKYFKKKCLIGAFAFLSAVPIMGLILVNIKEVIPPSLMAVIVFTGAAIPTVNSIAVDLFPTNLRGMAGCLTLMCSRLGTVTSNLQSGNYIDTQCLFILWTLVISLFGGIICVLLLPNKHPSFKEDNKTTEI